MLKPFNALRAGKVLEQTDGVAEMWIRCGRAERMVPDEVLDIVQEVARQPMKPKRGRPRKVVA
jgi:hypothetical protein